MDCNGFYTDDQTPHDHKVFGGYRSDLEKLSASISLDLVADTESLQFQQLYLNQLVSHGMASNKQWPKGHVYLSLLALVLFQ